MKCYNFVSQEKEVARTCVAVSRSTLERWNISEVGADSTGDGELLLEVGGGIPEHCVTKMHCGKREAGLWRVVFVSDHQGEHVACVGELCLGIAFGIPAHKIIGDHDVEVSGRQHVVDVIFS